MSATLAHQGLPPGKSRLELLRLVEDLGKRALGISSTASRVLQHYIWRSRDSDYQSGRICAVWEKVANTAEKLELCPRAINEAERELERLGFIVRTTGGNGARSGMRSGDLVRWAAGINLAPLIARYNELKALWEARCLHRQAIVALKAEIRRISRAIRTGQRPELLAQANDILPAGRVSPINDLARLEAIKAALKAVLAEIDGRCGRLKASDPSEENCRPKILTQDSSQPCSGNREVAVTPEVAFELASQAYRERVIARGGATWPNLVEASQQMAGLIGISQSAWGHACNQLGRERAAVCVIVVERNAGLNRRHPYRATHAAKCFAGMLRRASSGSGFNLHGLLRAASGPLEAGASTGQAHSGPDAPEWLPDPMLAAQVRRLHASLMLAQHPNDLILGKSASPHRSSPSDELTYQWHEFWGAGQSAMVAGLVIVCVVVIMLATLAGAG